MMNAAVLEKPEISSSSSKEAGLAGLSVLVAEADADHRAEIEKTLTDLHPDNLTICENGAEAMLALMKAEQIDLLITNLQMPVMDGVRLLRGVKESRHSPAIILISAVSSEILDAAGRVATANQLDVVGTIQLPVDLTQILERLGELDVLNQERRFRQARAPSATRQSQQEMSEPEIRAAMAEGRLQPFLQPKLHIVTNEVVGAEALARISDGNGGIIGPAAFIPKVETDRQLSIDFTVAMLETMTKQIVEWGDTPQPESFSVNLPARCLSDPSLVKLLESRVKDHSIEPERLIFEVTETAAIASFSTALEVLTRLRLVGFGLSIDDYGTGHSSLERLASIPFTEVKIDRSFVRGCTADQSARKILGSAVRLAKDLGMKSVGEGAETEEELDLLYELGCDIVQGFVIGRPMPLDEFKSWIQKPRF